MSIEKENITVALASIPNTGKTTLFNQITGSHQSVGNWPGVSIEKKVGHFKLDDKTITLIDLPGAYSINVTSLEEKIVSEYLFNTPPDIIINLLDARNLYRSLGLTLQLGESGIPIVVAVNMMDEARREGIVIDFDRLSEHLQMPVVPIVARTGEGLNELKETLSETIKKPYRFRRPRVSWPSVMEDAIMLLARKIEKYDIPQKFDDIFIARRLLESQESEEQMLKSIPSIANLKKETETLRIKTEKRLGVDMPTACAKCRFNSARGLVAEVSLGSVKVSDETTERLDNFLMNKYFGIPIFFFVMFIIFQGIYRLGVPLQEIIGDGFGMIQNALLNWGVLSFLPEFWKSFLIEGIFQGLGIVISFFPLIALFFIFMSIIEDTGYMARAAFLMDRLMHTIGLDGKAFINILLGYGCNVPAVMGTRIMTSQRNRIITMLLIPFTLCSARLQVFVFVAGILYSPAVAPLVLFALYTLSFVIVILVGLILKLFDFAGKPEPFIIEIPPYRKPMVKTVAIRVWMEAKDFLYRASTLIIIGVILVWLLTHLPTDVAVGSKDSWAGILGHKLLPIFHPLGIEWQEIVALLFGFVAKEIVLGSMAVIYGADPAAQIAAVLTPLQGLSFMVFALLYSPCIPTIAAIKAEARSWKIMSLSIALGLVIAWVVTFIIYRAGLLFGFG